MSTRNFLVTGATGFIGGHVIRAALARGDRVWALSRNPATARGKLPDAVRVVGALSEIPPTENISVIVNLAGAPVIGPPWTRARRKLLIDSRVQTTAALLAWCATRPSRPAALISASAIGFYGPAGDDWLDGLRLRSQYSSRSCAWPARPRRMWQKSSASGP